VRTTISVTTAPAEAKFRAGQSVMLAAQLVSVNTDVAKTVNVVERLPLVVLAKGAVCLFWWPATFRGRWLDFTISTLYSIGGKVRIILESINWA